MPLRHNIILDTDSYKLPMFGMYPDDVRHVFSYAESRGGRYPSTVFFGLQPLLLKLANGIWQHNIEEAEAFAELHGEPFNKAGWEHILNEHDGRLPLLIKAVPEGTLVPTRNVLCTVENTDPAVPWLTTYVETALLRQVWYATTVATRIFNMKRGLVPYFDTTSDDRSSLPFALLDFSSRGCASLGANELGGAAYLAHFLGSDSVPAVRYVNQTYGAAGGMSGFSVPATEHSIMCSWGQSREYESFKAMIDRFGGPGKIVSVVSDTWDIFAAAEAWSNLAPYIQNSGTTLVVRPDSGSITQVLPKVLDTLHEGFGSRENSKGYRVLNGVKVLWGDGIDEHGFEEPFMLAKTRGISADSVMIGSGGGLMQKDIDRDTCKFAFKASAVLRAGEQRWEGIAKDPITDPGKQSKKGRLMLVRDRAENPGGYATVSENGLSEDLLKPVFLNGQVVAPQSIDTVRERIDSQL